MIGTSIQTGENLGTIPLSLGTLNSKKIPGDRVVKGINVTISGVITPTFASGSPTVKPGGIFRSLVDVIKLIEDGGKTIRNIRPDMLQLQAQYLTGSKHPRLYHVNSSVLGAAAVQGDFTIGATTQPVAVSETYHIPLEHHFSGAPYLTHWNLNGKQNARIELNCKAASEVLTSDSDAATIEAALEWSVYVSSNPGIDLSKAKFNKWIQDFQEEAITGSGNKDIEITASGRLHGFWLSFFKGDDFERMTYEECKNIEVEFIVNGQTTIKRLNLFDVMNENVAKNAIPSLIAGQAYINLQTHSSYTSGLPLDGLESVKVRLRMPSIASIDYSTDNVYCRIDTNSVIA